VVVSCGVGITVAGLGLLFGIRQNTLFTKERRSSIETEQFISVV